MLLPITSSGKLTIDVAVLLDLAVIFLEIWPKTLKCARFIIKTMWKTIWKFNLEMGSWWRKLNVSRMYFYTGGNDFQARLGFLQCQKIIIFEMQTQFQ